MCSSKSSLHCKIEAFLQVAMYVASEVPRAVRGVCLLNCVGGMNQRGLYKDSLQLAVMRPIFELFEFLLKRKNIAAFLFSKFRWAMNPICIRSLRSQRHLEHISLLFKADPLVAGLVMFARESKDQGA